MHLLNSFKKIGGTQHGGAPRTFSRGRKKGAARDHKAEPALSPKVGVFSEENNGFGGQDTTGKRSFFLIQSKLIF